MGEKFTKFEKKMYKIYPNIFKYAPAKIYLKFLSTYNHNFIHRNYIL